MKQFHDKISSLCAHSHFRLCVLNNLSFGSRLGKQLHDLKVIRQAPPVFPLVLRYHSHHQQTQDCCMAWSPRHYNPYQTSKQRTAELATGCAQRIGSWSSYKMMESDTTTDTINIHLNPGCRNPSLFFFPPSDPESRAPSSLLPQTQESRSSASTPLISKSLRPAPCLRLLSPQHADTHHGCHDAHQPPIS